jgi:hypothetical protein
MYPPIRDDHNGLIHELAPERLDVIPGVPTVVDRLWRSVGPASALTRRA